MKTPPTHLKTTSLALTAFALTSGLLTLTPLKAHSQNNPTEPHLLQTQNTNTSPKATRDWEKFPPITDSDIILYERETNVPIEERFETLERKAMSSWYESEATRRVLQLSAPSVKKQRHLLKTALSNLQKEEMSSYEREQLVEYTQQLFADTFPEALNNAPTPSTTP